MHSARGCERLALAGPVFHINIVVARVKFEAMLATGIAFRDFRLCAAAQAGFAVTPIAQSQLAHGLHAVAPDAGLPVLPDVEFTMFAQPGASASVADELGNAIMLAFAHKG